MILSSLGCFIPLHAEMPLQVCLYLFSLRSVVSLPFVPLLSLLVAYKAWFPWLEVLDHISVLGSNPMILNAFVFYFSLVEFRHIKAWIQFYGRGVPHMANRWVLLQSIVVNINIQK